MQDTTWVRTYNSKAFYSASVVRGDGGLETYSGGTYLRMWAYNGTNSAYIGVNNGVSRIGIDPNNSQVVIGDPGQYMNLRVRGTSGTICTIGTGTGNTSCTSDARLKNIDGVATSNLDKIMQLQPTYFRFKNDVSDRQQLGFITAFNT